MEHPDMNSEFETLVFEIIRRTLKIDPTNLDRDRDIREQTSLDSMQFVVLTAAVEKELGIELPLAVMEVRTISEFLRIVQGAMKP
jgi:acyl carrier protein